MPRRRRRHRYELNADVNVVSLIDVMLLLLVIFMITAPMMQGGVDVTLPAAEAHPLESKDGLNLMLTRDGVVSMGEEKYPLSQFKLVFKTVPKNRTRNGVYLSADKDVPYGLVVQLMAILSANGVTNMGVMTRPEEAR